MESWGNIWYPVKTRRKTERERLKCFVNSTHPHLSKQTKLQEFWWLLVGDLGFMLTPPFRFTLFDYWAFLCPFKNWRKKEGEKEVTPKLNFIMNATLHYHPPYRDVTWLSLVCLSIYRALPCYYCCVVLSHSVRTRNRTWWRGNGAICKCLFVCSSRLSFGLSVSI